MRGWNLSCSSFCICSMQRVCWCTSFLAYNGIDTQDVKSGVVQYFLQQGRSQNGQSCTIPVLCNKYAHVHLTASRNLVLRVLSEHCSDIIFEVNSTTLPFYINTLISKLVRHLHSPSFSASFTSVFVPWRLSSWYLSLPVSAMLLTCK